MGEDLATRSGSSIADPRRVRALLIETARARTPTSYGDLLAALGHRFTRPKMRALCKTLDAIDDDARARGEPELAVLVVRAADHLPGQGWWAGGRPLMRGYEGPWSGPDAKRFVDEQQALAFDHWGR